MGCGYDERQGGWAEWCRSKKRMIWWFDGFDVWWAWWDGFWFILISKIGLDLDIHRGGVVLWMQVSWQKLYAVCYMQCVVIIGWCRHEGGKSGTSNSISKLEAPERSIEASEALEMILAPANKSGGSKRGKQASKQQAKQQASKQREEAERRRGGGRGCEMQSFGSGSEALLRLDDPFCRIP